ncbi:MAG: hypothetical protein AB1696_08115 [Planctomycetota bacterium]
MIVAVETPAADWVRPATEADKPMWGIQGGLQFGIYPASITGKGKGGPRGLIRIGYPTLEGGRYDLINFIAVEPVVNGRKGFSEMENSSLDNEPGKRLWVDEASGGAGKLSRPKPDIEQLDVTIRVEKFNNGAHVFLVVSQRSDAPDEIALAIHAEPDSAPMERCILTATMGNRARTRLLWLRDGPVSSLKLFPDHRGDRFTRDALFDLKRLCITPRGDVIAALTTDEEDLAAVRPFPNSPAWYYGGAKVTQYWRKPKGAFRDDLHVRVNARYTYWRSQQPIPGGVAYENFEMRERFHDGQQFVFGVTRKTPKELTDGR